MGKIANRQSPIASVQRTRSTLASHSAVPRGTNVKRKNASRAIRIAAQRTQGLCGLVFYVSGGDMTANELAIRIAAITLASDSARTIVRFRPSKVWGLFPHFQVWTSKTTMTRSAP